SRCVTFPYVNGYILPLRSCFRIYQQLIASRADQEASVSAGVLDRRTHDLVDELFEHYLAGECLRDLDHGRNIEPFDGYFDRARSIRRTLVSLQLRMELLELPHFSIRSPPVIAPSCLSQIKMRDLLETARTIKAGSQLAGDSLVLDEAICSCRKHSALV